MIKIIAAGKVKEDYLRAGIKEFEKRISAYSKFCIIEVPDEMCPQSASLKEQYLIKEKEGMRILDKISDRDFVITLEISGRKMTSEGFADYLNRLAVSGQSDVTFVIGGSLGLWDKVSERSDLKLSFSDMTFPHQLMRLILCEQLYRSFRINRNEPYHK